MKIPALLLLALSLSTALSAAPVNYGGHWTLDHAASKNLPAYLGGGTHSISVMQDHSRLYLALAIVRPNESDLRQVLEFNLDGSPVTTSTTVHTPNGDIQVPMTTTLVVKDGALDITELRELTTPAGVRKLTSTEVWEMSRDRKTLTVHRKDELPNGAAEYDMVFRRG